MVLGALSLGLMLAGSVPDTSADNEARISIDVREASIHDIVRLLAEVAGFQVVMDPGITCALTLKLKQVRWPAVLDVALKSCGLGREEAEGVLRIAPLARLAEQAAAEQRLREAREQQRRTGTITLRKLSYARAGELAEVVRKLLPPGAQVAYDQRTNTLIIID